MKESSSLPCSFQPCWIRIKSSVLSQSNSHSHKFYYLKPPVSRSAQTKPLIRVRWNQRYIQTWIGVVRYDVCLCVFVCQKEMKGSHWPPQTGPPCKQTPTRQLGTWQLDRPACREGHWPHRLAVSTHPHTHTRSLTEVCATPSCGSAVTCPDSHCDRQQYVYWLSGNLDRKSISLHFQIFIFKSTLCIVYLCPTTSQRDLFCCNLKRASPFPKIKRWKCLEECKPNAREIIQIQIAASS